MVKEKKQIEVDMENLIIEDMPHLPITDKSEELIGRFLVKNITLADMQPEMPIFSHKHPLVYSNDRFPEDGEEIVCDACVDRIFSPPYYHCAECRYFLHLTCAKLPLQLELPIHSHQLSLGSKTRFDETFKCNRCRRHSNGFFFYCTTEGCKFYLDLSCAALPEVVRHECQDHPLVKVSAEIEVQYFYSPLEQKKTFRGCRCCGLYFTSGPLWMACTSCNFFLHAQCLLLPKTVKHRFDSNHPLILKFPPHDYHPNCFDCYQCELEIDPRIWLYHCVECDVSFHVKCINVPTPTMNFLVEYNMKFGQKAQIGSHPHPLKFVYKASVKSSRCHNCKTRGRRNAYFTLECETCNFRLCRKCIKGIEPPS